VSQCKSAVAALLLAVTGALACAAQSPVEGSADLNPTTRLARVATPVSPGFAADAAADSRAFSSTGNPRPALFFGFVEFDHDPNVPGGVPGFGPWPQPAASSPAP
jgi:hypothetical protein